MGGAPTIVWLRPDVGYAPEAAASMSRLEARLGRPHDCNSSYRDWNVQYSMWRAWEDWVSGRGPRPPHSRAIHPDASMHCKGLADDSDDWMTPGYIELAAEYGWIRTAASDPTERHHFEYQSWRDQHRNEPAFAGNGAAPKGWDEMATKEEIKAVMTETLSERGDTVIVSYSSSGWRNGIVLAAPGFWHGFTSEEWTQFNAHGLARGIRVLQPVNDRDYDVIRAIYTKGKK